MKQLGANQSGINGFSIVKEELIPVEDGAQIEILLNDHIHEIKFEDAKTQESSTYDEIASRSSLKRPRDDELSPRKQPKIEVSSLQDKGDENSKVAMSTEDVLEKIDNGLLYIFTTKGVTSSCKVRLFKWFYL